jgi:tetratricopeptide (TPR) repeat protein
MVVDAGCMKCMDCVSVCPNDALYFGFGKPALSASRSSIRSYSLSWPEEIFAAAVFFFSFMAVWDVYQLVPMLMALGIAAVTTYLAVSLIKFFRSSEAGFLRYALKRSGRVTKAGWVFLMFSLAWLGLTAHSGYVRYHERAGAIAFQNLHVPDELALAKSDPSQWLNASDRNNVAVGRRHFSSAMNAGLFTNAEALSKAAWLEYLGGDTDRSIQTLEDAAAHQRGETRALSLYYRGAILNRVGRYEEAGRDLRQALTERPDLTLANEELGESLWQLGRKQDAIDAWTKAVQANPDLVIANNQLAGAAAAVGDGEAAADYEDRANQATPKDPYFHWMLGLRLQNIGMTSLAEKHFQQAIQIDPSFIMRREKRPAPQQ